MTDEEFRNKVNRLQERANANPSGYRRRVGALIGIGYGYILLVLSILLGILGGLTWLFIEAGFRPVALEFAIPLVVAAFLILRSLWIVFPRPEGIPLDRKRFPELFAAIDVIVARSRTPRPRKVLLTDDYNAAVVQRPRLGLLGWHENYLLIGLPLLQALTPRQMKAVLAHEFGHLSGAHGTFTSRIYSVRQSWMRVVQSLEESDSWGTLLFRRFFRWFWPMFNAHSFVLARTQEYEADRFSAQVTDPRTAADALIRLSLGGRSLDETFWPSIQSSVRSRPEPPDRIFGLMARHFQTVSPRPTWLQDALAVETDVGDTHPSLRDRLSALGEDPRTLPADPSTAAQAFLGSEEEAVEGILSRVWRNTIGIGWKQGHAQAQYDRKRVQELEQVESPTWEQLAERAQILLQHEEWEQSEDVLRRMLEPKPDNARTHLGLALSLLSRDDESGLESLERASKLAPHREGDACSMAIHFLQRHGRGSETEPYRKRLEAFEVQARKASEERSSMSLEDTFIQHGLDEDELAGLRKAVRSLAEIDRAVLLRKKVETFPDQPFHAVCAMLRTGRFQHATDVRVGAALESLSEILNRVGGGLVFIVNDVSPDLRERWFAQGTSLTGND